jgi:hypothetical protein
MTTASGGRGNKEATMFDTTNRIKRLTAVFTVLAAVMVAVPVAQAWESPDAIDRYNAPVGVAWDGPPDSIDRYKAHQLLLLEQSQNK